MVTNILSQFTGSTFVLRQGLLWILFQILTKSQSEPHLVPEAYAVAESPNMPPCELYPPHIKVTFPGLKLYICGWARTEWAPGDVDKPAAN